MNLCYHAGVNYVWLNVSSLALRRAKERVYDRCRTFIGE